MVRPRPVPPSSAPRACLTKCLKHRAQILGLDADACVHDVEAQAAAAAALAHGRDDELNFALRRELDRVAEQIEQHLTDVAAVEHDERLNAGINPNRELQPFSLRPFLDDVAQIDSNLPQIAGRRLDVHPPGFDLREIEHVID